VQYGFTISISSLHGQERNEEGSGSMNQSPIVSLVFPVFNEEANIRPLYEQAKAVLDSTSLSYEFLFVDDGSRDASLEVIKSLSKNDKVVRFIRLSRNFGHEAALAAGLSHAQGQAVICMDADLQHPPSLIPEMVRLWEKGYDVVYPCKRNYATVSRSRLVLVRMAYWLLAKFSGLQLSFGQSDFHLLDRRVVNVLTQLPEYRKFLRGLVRWVGFRQTTVEYDVEPRRAGESKYNIRVGVSLLIDGILAFSIMPLRWSLIVGIATALLSLVYGIVITALGILNLIGIEVGLPPGWATVVVAILFLGSVQLVAIGLLSEYVGRIYEQARCRPTFIVQECSWNSASELKGEHD
jgi:dolichol-phosphate mannosyltransferase